MALKVEIPAEVKFVKKASGKVIGFEPDTKTIVISFSSADMRFVLLDEGRVEGDPTGEELVGKNVSIDAGGALTVIKTATTGATGSTRGSSTYTEKQI